jgi:ribose 5-phosphate isomerase B
MKRFEIITESDARVLPRGEPVTLARGGHVTPLAQDTLNERRVTVVHEGRVSPADASLVPRADIRTLAIASDHTGIKLRQALTAFLRGRGLSVLDLGTDGPDPVDYPDVAAGVARAVARREADAGIVIDGAGIGSAIAANKIPGIRAVMATTETIARYSREHNGCNVLTLGASLVSGDEAKLRRTPREDSRFGEQRRVERLRSARQETAG